MKSEKVKDQIFRYKRSKNIFAIIMVGIWVVLIVLELLFIRNKDWSNYALMGSGTVFIFSFGFGLIYQYARVKNGVFSIYADFIPKKILLSNIQSVRKSAGDYIVKTTQSKTIQINPEPLDEDSKRRLQEIFEIDKE